MSAGGIFQGIGRDRMEAFLSVSVTRSNKTDFPSFFLFSGIFLALIYTGFYLGDPSLPGNNFNPCCVTGWIGWTDQGLYYRSIRALAAGNLDPSQHWYPLGYAILATPFFFLRSHPFFPVDLTSLLIVYISFISFSRRLGVSAAVAVIVFLLSVCGDTVLFKQWVIPWTTTPAAAVIWALLAIVSAQMGGTTRKPLILGFLAACLPLIRPTDALISFIVLAWVLVDDIRLSRLRLRYMSMLMIGGAIPVVAYGALHVAIYGWNTTPYMASSGQVGFTLHNPIWRASILLLEPTQWFFSGQALFAREPWLLLGFAGSIFVCWRRGAAALLSVCLIIYYIIYIAYVDLLPINIWEYSLVHYFVWTFPGLGLLAWIIVKELYSRNRLALGALAVVFIISCIHVMPRPCKDDTLAVAVDMGPPIDANGNRVPAVAFAGDWSISVTDSIGSAPNVMISRIFPTPTSDGVRIIGIRRDLLGPLAWTPNPDKQIPFALPPPQRRWAEKITIGYPCWLPPYVCEWRDSKNNNE